MHSAWPIYCLTTLDSTTLLIWHENSQSPCLHGSSNGLSPRLAINYLILSKTFRSLSYLTRLNHLLCVAQPPPPLCASSYSTTLRYISSCYLSNHQFYNSWPSTLQLSTKMSTILCLVPYNSHFPPHRFVFYNPQHLAKSLSVTSS